MVKPKSWITMATHHALWLFVAMYRLQKTVRSSGDRGHVLLLTKYSRHLAQYLAHSWCLINVCCLSKCMTDPSQLVKAHI